MEKHLKEIKEYYKIGQPYWEVIGVNKNVYMGILKDVLIDFREPKLVILRFSQLMAKTLLERVFTSYYELKNRVFNLQDVEKLLANSEIGYTPKLDSFNVENNYTNMIFNSYTGGLNTMAYYGGVAVDECEIDYKNILPYKIIYNKKKETVVLFIGDDIFKSKRDKDDKFAFDILLGFYIAFYKSIKDIVYTNIIIKEIYKMYKNKKRVFAFFESVFVDYFLLNEFSFFAIEKLQNAIKSLESDTPKRKMVLKGVEIELIVV